MLFDYEKNYDVSWLKCLACDLGVSGAAGNKILTWLAHGPTDSAKGIWESLLAKRASYWKGYESVVSQMREKWAVFCARNLTVYGRVGKEGFVGFCSFLLKRYFFKNTFGDLCQFTYKVNDSTQDVVMNGGFTWLYAGKDTCFGLIGASSV